MMELNTNHVMKVTMEASIIACQRIMFRIINFQTIVDITIIKGPMISRAKKVFRFILLSYSSYIL